MSTFYRPIFTFICLCISAFSKTINEKEWRKTQFVHGLVLLALDPKNEGTLAEGWVTESGITYSNAYIAKREIKTKETVDVTLSIC